MGIAYRRGFGIYPNWFTVIPVGFGIRLKANQYIDILLEGVEDLPSLII